MATYIKFLHVECSNCPLCTEIIIFSKWSINLMISAFLKNCWCQQKLKLEYLLIGICYCLEILHTAGPVSPLSNKIKIYSTWGIYVMTSSFFKNFKKWWSHQKFRHYGKSKMWNLKNFVITTSVEIFISITFIYKEQWIKQVFALWACQSDDVIDGQDDVDEKNNFSKIFPNES